MNLAVAVQTGAPGKTDTFGPAGGCESGPLIIRPVGMQTAGVMTVLTEVGGFFFHQVFMAAAVRVVTGSAVFFNWRMLPNKGPPFVGVATVTQLIYSIVDQHGWRQATVTVVTVAAFDFAFGKGVVGNFIGGHPDGAVTLVADFRLINLGCPAVHRMTVDTGKPVPAVAAHLP